MTARYRRIKVDLVLEFVVTALLVNVVFGVGFEVVSRVGFCVVFRDVFV